MYLVIDHSGNQVTASRIDNVNIVCRGNTAGDLVYSFAVNQHVGITNLAFVDQAGIGNQQLVHVPIMRASRSKSYARSPWTTCSLAIRPQIQAAWRNFASGGRVCDNRPCMTITSDK